MTRSDAYVILGARFARQVEQDPQLRHTALEAAARKADGHREAALRALGQEVR